MLVRSTKAIQIVSKQGIIEYHLLQEKRQKEKYSMIFQKFLNSSKELGCKQHSLANYRLPSSHFENLNINTKSRKCPGEGSWAQNAQSQWVHSHYEITHTACTAFQTAKKKPLLIFPSKCSRDSQEPKTKIIFQFSQALFVLFPA